MPGLYLVAAQRKPNIAVYCVYLWVTTICAETEDLSTRTAPMQAALQTGRRQSISLILLQSLRATCDVYPYFMSAGEPGFIMFVYSDNVIMMQYQRLCVCVLFGTARKWLCEIPLCSCHDTMKTYWLLALHPRVAQISITTMIVPDREVGQTISIPIFSAILSGHYCDT